MVKIFFNPVVVSAFLVAFLLYSGIAKIRQRNPFVCLAQKSEIVRLEGFVSSNPVKTGLFGSSYRASFCVKKAFTNSGAFEGRGEVTVFFPSEIVEAYYPGKLYSKFSGGKKGFLVENGAAFLLDLDSIQKNGETVFLVKKCETLGWNGNIFVKSLSHFRALCRLLFKRLMYSWGNAGGLLLALLSGSREYAEKSVSDAFRESGLSHILALSGMHLGLFGGIAHFFGRKASGRNFGDAIQLGAVAFFVWFAGISPSLFRAFLAALFIYLNSLLRMNRPEGLSLLSFCFLLHCVIFPSHIMEAAFMLSYASLAGIIIFGKIFRKMYPAFIPYRIRLSLSDSSAAQLSTSPVALRLFGKIMPQGIIASLFVSPLTFLFLYLGLFGVIICLFLPFLSGPISAIMNGLYFLISKLVLFFSFK